MGPVFNRTSSRPLHRLALPPSIRPCSRSQSTNCGGGTLASGNISPHALITAAFSPHDAVSPAIFMPNTRPLNDTNPSGTDAMGNPADAATLAMRASAGPIVTSELYSAIVCLMEDEAGSRRRLRAEDNFSGVLISWSAASRTSWFGCSRPSLVFCARMKTTQVYLGANSRSA